MFACMKLQLFAETGGPQDSVKQFPNCLTGLQRERPIFQAFPNVAMSNNPLDLWVNYAIYVSINCFDWPIRDFAMEGHIPAGAILSASPAECISAHVLRSQPTVRIAKQRAAPAAMYRICTDVYIQAKIGL